MRQLRLLIVVVAVLLVGGAIVAKEKAADAPKKGKSAVEVQIFRGTPPERPYKVLGIVSVQGMPTSTNSDLVMMIKQEAAEMGADAVIDVETTFQTTGTKPSQMLCPDGKGDCVVTDAHAEHQVKGSGKAVVFTDKKK